MDRKNQTPQGKVLMFNSCLLLQKLEFMFEELPTVILAKTLLALIGQIAQVVVEFLEVAVSCIVFLKGFYPTRKNSSHFCV